MNYELPRGDVRIYYDNEDISVNEDRLLEVIVKEDFVDIVTSESMFFVSVTCLDNVVTLHVPGTITLGEIKDVETLFTVNSRGSLRHLMCVKMRFSFLKDVSQIWTSQDLYSLTGSDL